MSPPPLTALFVAWSVSTIACAAAPGASEPYHRVQVDLGGEPSSIAAADLNGDGIVDLAVTDQEGGTLILLAGDGRGGFERFATVEAGSSPCDVAAGDVNEDGWVDLVVANHETDHVTVVEALGRGAFRPRAEGPLEVDVSPHLHAVALADLDSDGHLDLLVDHRDGEGLWSARGLGDGGFEPGVLIPIGGDPYRGFSVADLDRDGALDLVAPIPRGVGVRLNDGAGGFRSLEGDPPAAIRPFAVVVADRNGDGKLDLAVGSGEGPGVLTLLDGDGEGGFRPAAGSPLEADPGAKRLAAADLDGDGRDDLVVTSWGSSRVQVVYGGEGAPRRRSFPTGSNPYGVVAEDFDGDDHADLAVVSFGDGMLTLLLSARPTPGP